MAAAIPLVASAIGSYISSRQAGKSAEKTERIAGTPTPEEQASFKGGMGAAGQLSGMGRLLYGQGATNVGQASDYWQRLMGRGGKEAALAAVGPQMGNISQIYGGVSRGLEGRNVRGGVKDLALAEAEREKAGQMSRLIHGVQPRAAGELANIGTTLTGQGIGATGGAGGIFADLLGKGLRGRGLGFEGRLAGEGARGRAGADIGKLLFTALAGMGGGGKSGGRAAGGAGLTQLGSGTYQGLPVGT